MNKFILNINNRHIDENKEEILQTTGIDVKKHKIS